MTLLPQAPAVFAVAADDADTAAAAVVPRAAGQRSVVSQCRVVGQQQDDVAAAAEISWLSFSQHLPNEVQSA